MKTKNGGIRDDGQNDPLSFREFEDFFRKNFQAASLIAYRYISDHTLAEDIVQESFVSLWEKRSQIYTDQENLRKYLFVTVRNRAISYWRKIRLKQVELEDSLTEIEMTDHENTDSDEDLAIRIFQATQKLPQKCREIFLLAYTQNMSYQEIADRKSVSKNTVKTQMVIAYRLLRKELKEIYLHLIATLVTKRGRFSQKVCKIK